jgi:hypothetical protein
VFVIGPHPYLYREWPIDNNFQKFSTVSVKRFCSAVGVLTDESDGLCELEDGGGNVDYFLFTKQ